MTATVEAPASRLIDIPLGDLHPRPENLRQEANGEDLVASIKAHGILQPLNVSTRDEGGYWINAGHRRLDGAQRAGLMFVPGLVDERLTDSSSFTFAMLIENMQREDLSPIEQGRGFKRLVDLGVKQAEIAKTTGLSPSLVSRRVKLLELPAVAIERIETGELSLELAEQYTKLDPEVLAVAVDQQWDAYRVKQALQRAEEIVRHENLEKAAKKAGVRLLDLAELGLDHDDVADAFWNPVKVDGQWHRLFVARRPCDIVEDGKVVDVMDIDQYHGPDDHEALVALAQADDVFGVVIGWANNEVDPDHSWDTEYLLVVGGGPLSPEDQKSYDAELEEREERRAANASTNASADAKWKEAEAQRKAKKAAAEELAKAKHAHFAEWAQTIPTKAAPAKDVASWAMRALVQQLGYQDRNRVAAAMGWVKPGQGIAGPAWDKAVKALDGKGLISVVVLAALAGDTETAEIDYRGFPVAPGKGIGAEIGKAFGWVPYKKPGPAKKAAAKKAPAKASS